MSLDKNLIAQSFSQAAERYEEFALLQQEVASRVFERLSYMRINPKNILDVGCGTGYCSRQLRETFGRSKVSAIDLAPGMIEEAKKNQSLFRKINYQVADADELPFDDNQFDLIFSNLTIQWMPDLKKTFSELNRVLKPGGLLIFSTLGPDTLIELKESWRQVDKSVHVNEFIDMHIVGDQVFNAHFENTVMDRDVITLTYKTLIGLMRDLKAIGAHNIDSERQRGLLGKGKFNQLNQAYEKYRWSDGNLPATYEVIYGHAWKKQGQPKADYHTYKVDIQKPE
ncbi:malonyl-ACP O-methyltransferase BioC [Aliikangiella coralliicola]|uniref:Malonyl-[acyl-carrier protein] O-methyltransferase n=1 Tax=Aliikangiella coralliicola TaxID=2592383 RepID=A0A545UJS2_9GAMM|nr:malonyl-ACP O-methyltransferase BioC [Aliikangiella coralliicola]TQV89717.1 malonyl-ACP O-methyltransferase BioC [Aliikangiella coralliicola]